MSMPYHLLGERRDVVNLDCSSILTLHVYMRK